MSSILHRRGRWYRLRWQVAGGLLSALIPYAVRLSTMEAGSELSLLHTTFVGSAAAILFAAFLLREVGHFPGAEGSAYILPALSMSFGILLLVFLFGRIEYARALIISSFVLSLAWFYFIYFLRQRDHILRIGVIRPFAIDQLPNVNRVEWVELPAPDARTDRLAAVAVDLRTDLADTWERRLADFALSGLPVYHIKHLLESLTGRVQLEHLTENSFGMLSPVSAYMTVKHLTDFLLAVVALILLFPVMILIGFAVRLDSKGPAIFQQQRTGYRGRAFTVFKFRTMTVATPEESIDRTAAVTGAGDRRITGLGTLLRKYRLDELPQILNIVKGEMSWIGPRPEPEILSEWFETQIAFYRYRHIVRPGITGWAQVCQGYAAELDEIKTKLHYDFYYIKNYSPWIDLLILARTIRIMVTGSGSR